MDKEGFEPSNPPIECELKWIMPTQIQHLSSVSEERESRSIMKNFLICYMVSGEGIEPPSPGLQPSALAVVLSQRTN